MDNGSPVRVCRDDLRRWLASGRCQDAAGAFCAWRDATTDALAFPYPEITGYALNHLAGRPAPTPQEVAAGRRAADWIVARLAAGNYAARDGWDGGAVYNFDHGMIATGLLTFGALVGDERYTRQGLALVEYLASQIGPTGGLPALSAHHPVASDRRGWSTEGQPHLAKIVQCLLLAAEREHPGADRAAARLIAHTKTLQGADGRFVTQPHSPAVMLHPHLYTVEGLWMWGTARGDDDALDRARAATRWLWQHQLPTGGFPRHVAGDDATPAPEQTDVTAQAVRMALALCPDLPTIPAATARLVALAHPDAGGRALVYQFPTPHLNAWVTMFGQQALEMAVDGAAALSWRKLV